MSDWANLKNVGRHEMMKIIGINGSPRKNTSNTLKLIQAVLDGAKEGGAKTEVIDICKLDINFCTGVSCFATIASMTITLLLFS